MYCRASCRTWVGQRGAQHAITAGRGRRLASSPHTQAPTAYCSHALHGRKLRKTSRTSCYTFGSKRLSCLVLQCCRPGVEEACRASHRLPMSPCDIFGQCLCLCTLAASKEHRPCVPGRVSGFIRTGQRLEEHLGPPKHRWQSGLAGWQACSGSKKPVCARMLEQFFPPQTTLRCHRSLLGAVSTSHDSVPVSC